MITLFLLILAILAVLIIVLALAGIIAVAWPVLIIIGMGLIIDILMFKVLFKH